ncbi:MAG: hypothetical protein QOI48_3302, partial [Solirubrobacteraceae bacterium]|nr:hypothetical protein [Solirubrobacteraceae bacterium]
RHGIGVLKPMVEGGRYDLVFEMAGHLLRIQCKVARKQREIINVRGRTCRRKAGGGYVRSTYTPDEVDAIAGYCPELDRCYLIPIREFPKSGGMYLRLSPSKNNQQIGLNWASDYELGAIAQLGERRAGSA